MGRKNEEECFFNFHMGTTQRFDEATKKNYVIYTSTTMSTHKLLLTFNR